MWRKIYSNTETRKIIRYIVNIFFCLALIAIAILSLVPQPPDIRRLLDFQDKIEHFLVYTALSWLTYFVFVQILNSKRARVLAPVLFCTVYGSLLEVVQQHTGRLFEYGDILVNLLGSLAGTLLANYIFIRMQKAKNI